MTKLTRKTFLMFGSTMPSGKCGVFGSLAAGTPSYSTDPAVIQTLAAWGTGWSAETISNLRPAIQDFNAVDLVYAYMLAYLMQMGIPEWDAGTTYYTNSFCQVAGVIYKSLVDTNINYAPASSPTKWELAIELVSSYLDTDGTLAANSDLKIATQKATKTYADTKVAKTGDETVAGIKTFSSFPVTPSSAPTTNYQAANKKYVDDNKSTATDSSVSSLGTFTDNTVHQNTSTKKIMIIAVSNEGGTNGDMTGYIGSTSSPATKVAYQEGSNRHGGSITFICPPNWYWKATSNVGSQRIEAWEI